MTGARRATRWLALGLCISGLAAGAPVLADDEPHEPTLSDKETARSLFLEGDEKFRAGDFQGALKAFEAADAIMGVPTTGLERGRTLARLGRLLEAREVLLAVSRLPPEPDENEVQQHARLEAAQLADEVGSRIPSLTAKVSGLPEGADFELSVDGEAVAPELAAIARKVDPGKHEVKVGAEGYRPETRTVQVSERDNAEVHFEMVALSTSDGTTPPTTPAEEGYTLADVPLVSWVGFGVGAAGFIVGGVAGGVTLARTGSLDDDCPGGRCPDRSDQSRIDAAKASAHASTAGFVIGGVGVAFGVATLLLWPEEGMLVSSRSGAAAPLRVTLGIGAVGVAGAF